jgi:diguanylate cyclase (GGDEF)-like protein/PAS domain S-box-containing protein
MDRAMTLERARRILIVDDNLAIHDDFRKILGKKQRGAIADVNAIDQLEAELFGEPAAVVLPCYEVDSAYQGEQALAMVVAARDERRPYALVFVDMRMPPGWDGVQTVEKLWEADPTLQIVICTAYSDYSWEEILLKFGATDHLLLLKKPFDTAEVCQLACALTEKWDLARHAHLKLTQLQSMVVEQTRELEQSNQKLRDSETRYALAAAGANDGLWDWDLALGSIFLSPRWKSMIGFSDEEMPSFEWISRVHADDRERVALDFAAHVQGRTPQFSCEYRILHQDGHYRWMLCRGLATLDAEGRPARAAGSQTDITNRKMAEAQLRHDALHDTLTGLPNRTLLAERLERCIVQARRTPGYLFAVLFIDVDHFKVVNDSLGHLVGDQLLIALAKRLNTCVRATDTLSFDENELIRFGGDEFVLLLQGLRGESDVLRLAERIQLAAAEPLIVDGQPIHTSLSIGIALSRPSYQRADEMLRDADIALYRAKENGRGRYELFNSDMHESAVARWRTENELRHAIGNDELVLHYQPIFSVRTGDLTHFEALVRWQHPQRGLLSPGEFVALAEETGLIAPLGLWVVEEACLQLARWRMTDRLADLPIAVNVSGKQFAQPSFVEDMSRILERTGTDASHLRLEITESALMENGAPAMDVLKRLHEIGLKLHLDDFGTGYSSLSYLHRMPVDALKIDKTFVSTMGSDPASLSIAQTIIALARTLGIQVIAEGVETQAQLDLLRSVGCDAVQGYLFCRPISASAATEQFTLPPARRKSGTAHPLEGGSRAA